MTERDEIAAAEAVLNKFGANPVFDVPDHQECHEALSALLVVAKDRGDELARLKAPLGDEGRELVAQLPRLITKRFDEDLNQYVQGADPTALRAADYIERQAAALAAPVGDVEELAKRLAQRTNWIGTEPDPDCVAAAATLRTLSRQLGEVTKGVEAWRAEMATELGDLDREVTDKEEGARIFGASFAMAKFDRLVGPILAQHVPAQGVADA